MTIIKRFSFTGERRTRLSQALPTCLLFSGETNPFSVEINEVIMDEKGENMSELTKARIFTLREMLGSMSRLTGDVEILNECNETLITAVWVEDNVVPLDRVLSDSLLDREVLSYGTRDNRTIFRVRGEEDAE